jgi:hypothetical protein
MDQERYTGGSEMRIIDGLSGNVLPPRSISGWLVIDDDSVPMDGCLSNAQAKVLWENNPAAHLVNDLDTALCGRNTFAQFNDGNGSRWFPVRFEDERYELSVLCGDTYYAIGYYDTLEEAIEIAERLTRTSIICNIYEDGIPTVWESGD